MNKYLILVLIGLVIPIIIIPAFINMYSIPNPQILYKLTFAIFVFLLFHYSANPISKFDLHSGLALAFIALMIFLIASFDTTFIESNGLGHNILQHLIRTISTGYFEEMMFRLLLFIGIVRTIRRVEYVKILLVALSTSVVFSLIHLFNFRYANSMQSILNQVVGAFGLGFLLQSVFLRFKSLLLVVSLHGAINFFGTRRTAIYPDFNIENTSSISFWQFDWLSFLFVLLMTLLIILPIGILIFPGKEDFRKSVLLNNYKPN